MFRYYIFLILFVSFSTLFSQSFLIKGYVSDSTNGEPLIGANVLLISLPDSSKGGTTTNFKGAFTIENIKPGRYVVAVSYIGYNTKKRTIRVSNSNVDLGKINLSPGNVEVDEVVVEAEAPIVAQKSDTTEFGASSFKVNKDANAEELVAKMPGVTVQDGKVQSQGEDVKRVLVDGRQFFGDDPSAVLRNVPADIIEKIQVFDQQSDQARFTGFDDGNAVKTINIITRTRIQEGTFGKFTAGYGDQEKYKAGGNVNFFNNDTRITLLGQINNTNEQNFSSEDLLGVMQSVNRSRGRGPGAGMGPRGGGGGGNVQISPSGPGGNNAQDFTVNARNGLNQTKALGLNYSDKWGETLELSGSYFLNRSDNEAQSVLNREYFSSSSVNQNYDEINSANSKNTNHRFNMRMEYKIDSMNSIIFRPRLSYQINDGSSSYSGLTYAETSKLNSVKNLFSSNLTGLNTSADFMFMHRFETRGRTVSAGFTTGYKKNQGSNDVLTESIYYGNKITTSIIDEISDMDKKGYNGSANFVYTEPLSENGLLQVNSRFAYSEDKNDQITYDFSSVDNGYTLINPSLSNIYKKIYRTQSYGSGYRYSKDRNFFNVNLNYNISQLDNEQTFPVKAGTKKTFYSLTPSMMLRWTFSLEQNLNIFYRANNNDPSVDQLQNVINNSNPVQLSIGNPDLKQDFRHNLFARYSYISFQNMQSFFALISGSFTNDYIGNKTIFAEKDTTVLDSVLLYKGTTLVMPVNLDGQMSLRSFFTFTRPLGFLKTNLVLTGGVNYSRVPSKINEDINYANTMTYSGGISLNSNISDSLDFSISSNSSFANTKNSLRSSYNRNTFSQNTRIKFYWLFWQGFLIHTELSHIYDEGLTTQFNHNSFIWNLSLAKKFFSDNRAELRLTAVDILNQNINVQRNVTDTYIENSRSNVLGRYFILTFSYNLRAF